MSTDTARQIGAILVALYDPEVEGWGLQHAAARLEEHLTDDVAGVLGTELVTMARGLLDGMAEAMDARRAMSRAVAA